MFAYFRGLIARLKPLGETGPFEVWIETGSVGYRVLTANATAKKLRLNQEATLYVSQSSALYGGETTLYGFVSEEDRALFELLREIPGAGAKKALDYFDKIQEKSVQSFLEGLVRGDAKMLATYFGFREKTAAKMLANLKERAQVLLEASVGRNIRNMAAKSGGKESENSPWVEGALWSKARDALVTLGFDWRDCETALGAVSQGGKTQTLESLVKEALKELAAGRV
ncbi:MAG: hypothetical protein HY401_05970 [Elusimicrobia bacterium]|nr:hypothetical protein [Elusimicrobiota bacterium]